MQHTIIYHARCPDGFAAALAAYAALGAEAVFIPASHGDALPEISGGTVYVVDFAYDLPGMQALARQADRLVWLDHHASVLPVRDALEDWLAVEALRDKVHIEVEMAHSGAVLAWQFFFPDRSVPKLFRHVEDRDLWRWQYPETEGFCSALDDLPMTFEAWEALWAAHEADAAAYRDFVETGRVGQRKYLKLCEQIAERAEPIHIAGVEGLQVNAPGEFASHIGHILAERSGSYAVIWQVKEGLVRLSFRGRAGFDVLPLAQRFGGGGHRAAAGARIPLAELPGFLGLA